MPDANPYNYNLPVEPAMFFGRDADVAALAQKLTGAPGDSIALVGGRRMGKTSMLEALRRALEVPAADMLALPILLDLSGEGLDSADDLFRLVAEQARDASLRLYTSARDYARERGILIADTKFEFGLFEGRLILIDEVLTPDSSRFWPASEYAPGKGQPSFDKQFVRDYLEEIRWNKQPPVPSLPDSVVARTRELEEAQRALAHQKRMTSLGQLAAALAHEVANPLNFTVGGAGELARRLDALAAATDALAARDPDNLDAAKARLALKGARKALELVQGGNDRIRGVIDALRAYTRSDTRGVEAVDLAEAVRATTRLMAQRFREAEVDVSLALDGIPRAKGRVSELSQVFMNLLLNSVQAMPEGGAITVTGRSDEGRVTLTFADTGPGIPPERRSKVFDPYYTTREDDGGTGLGLSISHEIVARHGGTLRLLDSDVGAVFEVSLPRWSEADAPS